MSNCTNCAIKNGALRLALMTITQLGGPEMKISANGPTITQVIEDALKNEYND